MTESRDSTPTSDAPTAGPGPSHPLLPLFLKHQGAAWRRGERALVEDYLAQQPTLQTDDEAVLDLIYHEIVLREEAGESPEPEEYFRRFPELAHQLTLQFDMEAALDPRFPSALSLEETLLEESGPRLSAPAPAHMPTVAGYEMLGELGRGGMGVVYKARQLRLNRVVALKMILAGEHAGPEAIVRFLGEAELIARLHHPHIIQIFAFGDCDGRPYFEMEYVAGGSLSDRLDGTARPVRDAARLVETLARAIQEAHRLGIVHRDLKPANVLLTADGIPKIADFGLAKWLDLETGLTRTQSIVGSPCYMAPEQARPGSTPIGPTADVYSLGTILYELLTGRPPFQAATVIETLDKVRLQEPISPTRLRKKLPRDLVTICLKCLEKDPARRYASAADLAEDLRRFDTGESIRARPASRHERLWRWSRREPAVASLVVAVLLGLVGVATQWWRAEKNAHRQAQANQALQSANSRERIARRHAQERFDAAMKALQRFEEITQDAALLREPRLRDLRADLLRTAAGFYKELQSSLEGDASHEAQSQLADAYARVGRITWQLGLPEEALAAHRRSLALLEQMAAAAPADPAVQSSLGRSHAQVGFALRSMGRPAEALRFYEQARTIQEPLARDNPAHAHYREVLSWTLSNLGVIHLELGHPADAVAFHRLAAAIHKDLVGRDPGNAHLRSDLAWSRRYLSLAVAASGDLDGALRLVEPASALHEKLVLADPDDVEFRWRLARCLDAVGRIHSLSGRPDRAAEPLARATVIYEALSNDNPVFYGIDLARNQLFRASHMALSGRPEEARACVRRAEEVLKRSSNVRPEVLFYDMACADCLWSVAGQDGVIEPAEREWRTRRAVEALRQAVVAGHRDLGQIRNDPALDPLRPRRDFQELLLDLSFPTDPFQP